MISLLVPTRQRPDLCYKMVESALVTSSGPSNLEILLFIDDDDPEKHAYMKLFKNIYTVADIEKGTSYLHSYDKDFKPVSLFIGTAKSVGQAWNFLAKTSAGGFLLMGNDDLVYVTPNWDTKLKVAFLGQFRKDMIGIAFADDGINHGNHCAFPMVHRTWIDVLGQFTTEAMEFMYHDTWMFDIAKLVDRVHYCPDILVKHNHWSQTGEKDATTKRHRDDTGNQRIARDKTLYYSTYLQEVRLITSQHLQTYINNLGA